MAPKDSPPAPRPSTPAPRRSGLAFAALKVVVGALAWVLSAALVFVVVEAALAPALAVVAVVLVSVLAPLALAQLLTPAFRRLDRTTTFVSVAPGAFGLCALVTLVALPLAAPSPVARALVDLRTRHPELGATPSELAARAGRLLDTNAAHDGGVARDAATDVPHVEAGVTVRDASSDASDAADGADVDDDADARDGDADDVFDATDANDADDAGDADVAMDVIDASSPEDPRTMARVHVCDGVRAIVAGDLEGDARDELVVACEGEAHVLAWTEGTLAERVVYRVVPPATLEGALGAPVIYDVNGDGRRDVVLCERYRSERGGGRGGVARYLVNDGDGRFGALVDLDRLDGCGAVAFGDINGDRRDEMLIAHAGNPYQPTLPQGDVTWYTRAGRTWTRHARLAVGRNPVAITLTDVSSDGVLDALVTHDWENTPPVVLPGSRGGLRAADLTLRPEAPMPARTVTARFDLDDRPDEAVVTDAGDVLLSAGAPTGRAVVRALSGTPRFLPMQPAVADAAAVEDAAGP